jgi:hypothetical protein
MGVPGEPSMAQPSAGSPAFQTFHKENAGEVE